MIKFGMKGFNSEQIMTWNELSWEELCGLDGDPGVGQGVGHLDSLLRTEPRPFLTLSKSSADWLLVLAPLLNVVRAEHGRGNKNCHREAVVDPARKL